MKLYVEGEMNFPILVKNWYRQVDGCVWVTGTSKKKLKELGFEILDIIKFDWHNYIYLIDENEYRRFLRENNLPHVYLKRF